MKRVKFLQQQRMLTRISMMTQRQWLGFPLALWIIWALGVSGVLMLCYWRYRWHLYTGIDLGIYNQVLWNTANGRIFQFSFNEASYLVDHREWLLILLTPLKWITDSPFALVLVQALAVSAGVFPLYALIQRVHTHAKRRVVGIATAICYLLFPTVVGTQLFEFHLLAFCLPLILWWWLSVVRRQRVLQWVLFAALLLLREDMAVMTAAAGLLIIFINKTEWKKGSFIFLLSVLWFGAMVKVGAALSVEETPLFFSLYSWMGATPLQAISFLLLHPIAVIQHLFSLEHIVIVLIYICSVACLPLAAPRYLFPAGIYILIYFFMDGAALEDSLYRLHYGAPIVAWVFIAAVYGYERLSSMSKESRAFGFSGKEMQEMLNPLSGIFIGSAILFFGAHWLILDTALFKHEQRHELQTVIQRIPESDAVAASARFWPQLSQREELYFTRRIFAGNKHYSHLPYQLPPIDWLLLSTDEMMVNGHDSLDKRIAGGDRLKMQIEKNGLVLSDILETGVVYATPERATQPGIRFVSEEESVGTTLLEQRVHPILEVTAAAYDSTRKDFLITVKRKNDPYAQAFVRDHWQQQEVYFQLFWQRADGGILHTTSAPLGFWLYPVYDLPLETERVYRIALHREMNNIKNVSILFGNIDTTPSVLNTILSPATTRVQPAPAPKDVPSHSMQTITPELRLPQELWQY